jgi:hypothetical protein
MNSQGEIETLTEVKKQSIIRNIIEAMASNSLRTMCVAYKDFYPSNKCKNKSFLSKQNK